jgi:glutaredoxin-related protein
MKNRYLSISQLSQITGKDRATLSKRLENLKPVEEKATLKKYDAWEALPLIFAADNLKGMGKKIEMITYEIEKEKLQKIRTDNEVKMGKLVYISEVAKTVEKEFIFVKAQIKAIPAKLSKMLSMENDPVVINKLLTDTINETLNELISDKTYEEKMKELEQLDNEELQSVTESSN